MKHQIRVYTTAKRRHAELLRGLRHKYDGIYFTARWPVTVNLSTESVRPVTHWLNDNCDDIIRSSFVVIYAEPDDDLKTSLVEIGIAMAHDKRIYVVGVNPGFDPWDKMENCVRVPTIDKAIECIRAEVSRQAKETIGRGQGIDTTPHIQVGPSEDKVAAQS